VRRVILALALVASTAGCATIPTSPISAIDRIERAYRVIRAVTTPLLPGLPADVREKVIAAEARIEWALVIARTAATAAEQLQSLREIEAATAEIRAATR
jgi:hypothetical protein